MSVCVYSVFVLDSGLATGWSLVQGVLPNVLDQETEVKRSVSRMPYAPNWSNRNKSTQNWGLFRSEIISTFLHLVKDRFLASYVLDRFQSSPKDLNSYGDGGGRYFGIGRSWVSVHRMLQNILPRVKSYFLFTSKPESMQDLLSLVTTVAVAVAVEEQRRWIRWYFSTDVMFLDIIHRPVFI
jgi:hypothetical protein